MPFPLCSNKHFPLRPGCTPQRLPDHPFLHRHLVGVVREVETNLTLPILMALGQLPSLQACFFPMYWPDELNLHSFLVWASAQVARHLLLWDVMGGVEPSHLELGGLVLFRAFH